jgi:hypothetical protein
MKELKETVVLMTSADYKERFAAEYYQLETRLDKLETMLTFWDKGVLNFTPTCPRATYEFQIRAMKDYLGILQMRAKMEGIEL